MAAKRPNPVSKAVAVLFSSFLAPLVVNLTASALKLDDHKPAVESTRQVAMDTSAPVPNVTLLPPSTVTPRTDERLPGPLVWRPVKP
jgi:hypothetical protein